MYDNDYIGHRFKINLWDWLGLILFIILIVSCLFSCSKKENLNATYRINASSSYNNKSSTNSDILKMCKQDVKEGRGNIMPGQRYSIDKKLIQAVIQVESSGNPNAYNKRSGAIGLMQITPIVLKELKENYEWGMYIQDFDTKIWYKINGESPIAQTLTMKQMRCPNINKFVGTWYLNRLKNHYLKDKYTLERLLCAYNWGISNIRKANYDVSKAPKETRDYIKKVLILYNN